MVNQTDLKEQLEKLMIVMETNPAMPRLFGKLNLEMALMKHDMMKVIVNLFKDEFIRIRSDLPKDDIQGLNLASELISFFSSNKTVQAFSSAGEYQVQNFLEDHQDENQLHKFDFGKALHLTGSIFTNMGNVYIHKYLLKTYVSYIRSKNEKE